MNFNFKLLKKYFQTIILSFAIHFIVLTDILFTSKYLCYANSSSVNKTFRDGTTTKNPFRVVTLAEDNAANTINPYQIVHTIPQEKLDSWMVEIKKSGTNLMTYQQLKHYQQELYDRQIFDHVQESLKQLWEAEMPKRPTPKPVNYTGNIEEIEFSSDEDLLTIERPPTWRKATLNHSATIIFVHGVGDHGATWAYAIEKIGEPYMKVQAPNANYRKLTYFGGCNLPAWFDIKGDHWNSLDDLEGLRKALAYMHRVIYTEIHFGIVPERVIVGGYGQGGALALHAALTYPDKLGGIMVLNSNLTIHPNITNNILPQNEDIPIFQGHFDNDKFIPHEPGMPSEEEVKRMIYQAQEGAYQDDTHGLSEQELEDMRKFFKRQLPYIKLKKPATIW